MVMVEPPETMWPWVANCTAARSEGERVDARMVPEALVLIGEQHVEIARIDVGARGRQAPAPLMRGVGTEQCALPVDYARRELDVTAERRRAEGLEEPGDAARERRADPRHRDRRDQSRRFHAGCGGTSPLIAPARR